MFHKLRSPSFNEMMQAYAFYTDQTSMPNHDISSLMEIQWVISHIWGFRKQGRF